MLFSIMDFPHILLPALPEEDWEQFTQVQCTRTIDYFSLVLDLDQSTSSVHTLKMTLLEL